MLTLSAAAALRDEQLFTGRERELAFFWKWLADEGIGPTIVNVYGPPGDGKSTMLRACARMARRAGRGVIVADASSFAATSSAFLNALGVGDRPDPLEHLNQEKPVILIDSFEKLASLIGYLCEEFLPSLSTGLKLVVASHTPLKLSWPPTHSWQHVVLPLPLERFSTDESGAYLLRRGVVDEHLISQIIQATAGYPLGLAFAADLVLDVDLRHFSSAPEWYLTVRSLVERLLAEVTDPDLRALLDLYAVGHQLDEATLAAVGDRGDISAAFDELCHLSVLRPAEHGLVLREEARRLLSQDLRWRHPSHYSAVGARLRSHFRERAVQGLDMDKAWSLTEFLLLSSNKLIQELLAGGDEPEQPRVEPALASDHAELRRVWTGYLHQVLQTGPESRAPASQRVDCDFLAALLAYSGTRTRIVRDRAGKACAFSTTLPISLDTLPLLDRHPGFAQLVHAQWTLGQLGKLPSRSAASNIFYFLHLARADATSQAAQAALLRDHLDLIAQGGTYLCCTPVPRHKWALANLGFERIRGARNWFWGEAHPADGFILDLARIGLEPWLNMLTVGGLPAARRAPDDGLQRLTPRESEVLALLARGYTTNHQLATELFITGGTANLHVKHILSKLGLTSRAQVAAWATRRLPDERTSEPPRFEATQTM
jgi:DNA-binding CsgD family transcriptional regulator